MLSLFCPLGAAISTEAPQMQKSEHFQLRLPSGCVIEKLSSPSDFDLYAVMQDKVRLMGVYVGNAAHFPTLSAAEAHEAIRFEGGGVTMLTLWEAGAVSRREILVKTGIREGWPHAIHAWTLKLPTGQAALADQILCSLNVPKT